MVTRFMRISMIMIAWMVDFTAAGSCRAAKLCCQGRDSGCVIQKASPNAIIESPRDTPCYCDHACLKLNDCCDDFKESCNVLDCIASEWGEWSGCSNNCGIGVQTRTRTALQPDQNGGKHCPQMEHSRSCQSYDACHRKSHLHHNQEVALVSPAMRPSPSQNSIRKVTPGDKSIFDMASDNSSILYLFDRPTEPVYIPKGEQRVAFDIPPNYLPEKYRNVATEVLTRYNDDTRLKVPVKNISIPDLSVPMQLGRREQFSLFLPYHRSLAARLIEIFTNLRTYEDFLSVAVYCRDRLNPNMFIYALSVAILHRPDTKNLPLPPLSEIFPDKFMDGAVFSRAKEESNVAPQGARIPIEIPLDYTASDLDEEHRVAYFREDIGINLHHWHWHLVYPFDGPRSIVNKDRRGELFYYMHQQMQARYNAERLSNNLSQVRRFNNWKEPIPEGYFPKLDSQVASRTWPARPSGTVLKDINRQADQVNFDIQTLERFRDRMYEAIHTGAVVNTRGDRIPLTEKDGIDILGNLMESSILSPNPKLYGDLHNMGHVAISFAHDPDHRYLESFGIMGDPATAMRDPIFFAFHAFINTVFMEHKSTLPAYTAQQLDYPGVEIKAVGVQTPNMPVNTLSTYWTKSDIDLSRGMDFTPRGPIFVRFTHLNHADFKYNININNRSNAIKRGTVRIFIAPKLDERGLPFTLENQRGLMIELDKFQVTLKPGENKVERNSTQSSVTIPFERTFRNIDSQNRPIGGPALEQFNLCGCGWPQHMLIPKGNKGGYTMDMFVMISNIQGDEVMQNEVGSCNDAASFCGIRDSKYPDARPMGYPFDRRPAAGVNSLAQFLSGNMAVTQINIRFSDQVVPRTRSGSMSNSLNFP